MQETKYIIRDINEDIIEEILSEAKSYIKISGDSDDGLLKTFIRAAVDIAEGFTSKIILPKKIELEILSLSETRIKAKYTPIATIESFYISDGVNANKFTLAGQEKVKVKDEFFIFEQSLLYKDVKICYQAAAIEALKPSLKQGILIHVAEMFDGNITNIIPFQVRELYYPYRKVRI